MIVPFSPTPGSNPNLLDNWYFLDPINQRGVTDFTGQKYGIDRWGASCKAVAGESGIALEPTGKNGSFYQFLSAETRAVMKGRTVTASWLLDTGLFSYTFQIPESGNFDLANPKINQGKWYFDMYTTNQQRTITFRILDGTGTEGTPTVIAAKLELGDHQTLATQVDGDWVLNDPPPDKAQELLKCQRYYQVHGSGLYCCAQGSKLTFSFPFHTKMRASPTVSLRSETINAYNMDKAIGCTITNAKISSAGATTNGAMHIIIDGTYSTTPGNGDTLRLTSGDNYIALDANL